eukprot:6214593-Pleurochrysis_carterae.AAC.8
MQLERHGAENTTTAPYLPSKKGVECASISMSLYPKCSVHTSGTPQGPNSELLMNFLKLATRNISIRANKLKNGCEDRTQLTID